MASEDDEQYGWWALWFMAWLCLVDAFVRILTLARWTPELEIRYMIWYLDAKEAKDVSDK